MKLRPTFRQLSKIKVHLDRQTSAAGSCPVYSELIYSSIVHSLDVYANLFELDGSRWFPMVPLAVLPVMLVFNERWL